MKGTLTLPKVRHLIKLYRADVEGSAEQIKGLMRERWDELHPLLRMTTHDLVQLVEREDAVQVFARAVESAAAENAESRCAALRSAARRAAEALAAVTAQSGDTHTLPVTALQEALELWRGSGELAFGDRGVVDIVRLRALVRQCAHLDSTNIVFTDRELVITYNTTRGRGSIRLVLRARNDNDRVLVVPIRALAARSTDHDIHTQVPWPVDDEQDAQSPRPPAPPRHPLLVFSASAIARTA